MKNGSSFIFKIANPGLRRFSLRQFLKARNGTTAIEYGIYAFGIALAIVPAVQMAGKSTGHTFHVVDSAFSDSVSEYDNGDEVEFLGTDHDDIISGRAARRNLISGSGGNDRLTGQELDDRLDGGAGSDTMFGGAGADNLSGGTGSDLLRGGIGADKLDGGDGDDTADYTDSAAGVSLDLDAGTASGGDAEGDALTNIENLAGSANNDILTGDVRNNLLIGNAGNDILNGKAGNDVLNGGLGADHLDGGDDSDTASYASSTQGLTINLGNASQNTGEATGDAYTSIENLEGSAYNDILAGDAGNNILNGGNGDDILEGGLGFDTLNGGDGFDIASYAHATAGIGAYVPSGGNYGNNDGDTYNSIEGVVGSAYDDYIQAAPTGASYIEGGKGSDYLWSGGNGTSLHFQSGDGYDLVFGQGLNDTIEFGPGITANDLNIHSDGSSILIDYGSDRIQIMNGSGDPITYGINTIKFADGSVMNLYGDPVVNAIPGYETAMVVNFTAGIDMVSTGSFMSNGGLSDLTGAVFNPGRGNDVVDTGGENNTLFFQSGDGQDYIRNHGENTTVLFGPGVNAGNISIYTDDGNSIVIDYDNGDNIRFDNIVYYQKLGLIKFADGSSMNPYANATVNAVPGYQTAEVWNGTAGDDSFSATGGDVTNAGKGNDNIYATDYGVGASQTLFFQQGDGQDRVSISNVTTNANIHPSILFGPGINAGNVSFSTSSHDQITDLVITYGASGDTVTLWGALTDPNARVHTIHFADGTSMAIPY